ncbi:MAG: hypothetical protein MIO92_06175 [Methanosarcinaceae archaeon]|nr:hypothetical protein [Methanosarcinaceae archaeon]
MFDDILKIAAKLALAPVYVPYKILEKIDESMDSLNEPLYFPDHLP